MRQVEQKQGEMRFPEHKIQPEALRSLFEIVGEPFVFSDASTRENYARTTLAEGVIPSVVIKPKNRREVEQIVLVVAKYGLKIHPISTGKNWGYGDACAPTEGSIILDLSRMNRIIEVNEDLCYATIEPGVTQGQLYDYLQENDLPLWMDATGAGPDTSIIGNVLERGFGHSPYGDRYAHSCAYEVVLPSGEVLSTGFGNYPNSRVSEIYKYGIGPSLDGLFTQSNFGIVTKMTIWLSPRPKDFKVLFFTLKEEDDIVAFMEQMRPLRMDSTLRSIVHISNDLRTISTLQRFPHDKVDLGSHLSQEKRRELIEKYQLGFWVGSAGFYGTKAQNKADVDLVRKKLKGIKGSRAFVVGEFSLQVYESLLPLLGLFHVARKKVMLFKKIKLAFELLRGKTPNTVALGGLWRVKRDPSIKEVRSNNPLDHEAGFYWISPILPMQGAEVQKLTTLVEPIFHKYRFDLFQTLSMVSERALCAVMTINFDKHDHDEVVRARSCHDEVSQLLIANGYIPYRAGNHTMKHLDLPGSHHDFLKQIKNTIDPMGIISPGKYISDRN